MRRPVAVVVLVVAFFASGCGGGEESTGGSDAGTSGSESTAAAPEESTEPPAEPDLPEQAVYVPACAALPQDVAEGAYGEKLILKKDSEDLCSYSLAGFPATVVELTYQPIPIPQPDGDGGFDDPIAPEAWFAERSDWLTATEPVKGVGDEAASTNSDNAITVVAREGEYVVALTVAPPNPPTHAKGEAIAREILSTVFANLTAA